MSQKRVSRIRSRRQSSDSFFYVAEGMFLAQYKVLRENGHSPSEAFNETVEEATQSLFPLIGAHGFVCLLTSAFSLNSDNRPSTQDGLHVQRVLNDRPPWRARLGARL